ncbi:chlorohydrolase family protein [Pseudarthrobacter sp. J75]|uniref:chlorohydrolase family protein n=1 Tax=unclassified Pseudarthrobacter TaxID=2647000 RepID=UPI002E817A6F|nr:MULTISPECIES: chlorohydrolase family protein [unclassified Pseudarthrobacter]MEE2521211.1 chlorohydrolase family protein [Pseudarthrobacter sp. J47]MEE2528443.1 chlorohydrolase family protein [Pseudarthrobacter sp. J75]
MITLLSARHVLAFDGARHVLLTDGQVVMRDDEIIYVGTGYDGPVDERRDFGQSLIAPGLIDLDALTDIDHAIIDSWPTEETAPGMQWSEDYFHNRRRDVFSAAQRQAVRRFALAQLALHGVTTYMPIASEIHSSWAETSEELEGMARTSIELGLRGFLGPAYRSGINVTDGNGERVILFDEEEGLKGLADAERFLDYVDSLDHPLLTGVLLPCRIETLSDDLMRRTAALGRERDVLVRLHCLQQPAEDGFVSELTGRTVLEQLIDTGLLETRLLIPHGVVIDGTDPAARAEGGPLDVLARHGVSIIHCPLTSFHYAGMLKSFDAFAAAGINMCLGTDSFPPDLIKGIDVGTHLARIAEGRKDAGKVSAFFDAATLGGAKALGREDLGRLCAGAQADIMVASLADFRDGVVEDPLRTLILNGSARNVTDTYVAGRPVVVDGALPGVDLEALREEGQQLFEQMVAAYGERDYKGRDSSELFPAVYPALTTGR